ncbi:hypothetical protein Q8A73_021831 [Channa argus]|nr:hypothetical protein Q8A73_021831 [Channa argus]
MAEPAEMTLHVVQFYRTLYRAEVCDEGRAMEPPQKLPQLKPDKHTSLDAELSLSELTTVVDLESFTHLVVKRDSLEEEENHLSVSYNTHSLCNVEYCPGEGTVYFHLLCLMLPCVPGRDKETEKAFGSLFTQHF